MSDQLDPDAVDHPIGTLLGGRSIILVGMMGAGKSSIGRRLASRLQVPFVDADTEIETAANQKISDIFEQFGEDYFRQGEKRVIARLLEQGPQVLATGGGAFMDADTRQAARDHGISVWIDAPIELLMNRVRRRNDRPLLKTADPAATMQGLLDLRNPVYAEADIRVQSRDVPHTEIVDEMLEAIDSHLRERAVELRK